MADPIERSRTFIGIEADIFSLKTIYSDLIQKLPDIFQNQIYVLHSSLIESTKDGIQQYYLVASSTVWGS